MPDWGREAGLFETPLASATPAQAVAGPARLEPGWIVLSDCRIDGGDGPPDIVLLHPAIGVALLEMEPRWTADAETRFRQRLDAIGFARHYPGHLPVIHRRLRPADLPELPTLLTEAFSWQPSLSLPEGGAWVAAARRALTDHAAPAPSRRAVEASVTRPGMTRGRKLAVGVAGAIAAGIAVLMALPQPPDLVQQGAPAAAAAAPAGRAPVAPPATQLASAGPIVLPSPAAPLPATVTSDAAPLAAMPSDTPSPRLDEPPPLLAVAEPPLRLAQLAAAPPDPPAPASDPTPVAAAPEPPLPALELPPDVAAPAVVAPPPPPPPLPAMDTPPDLVLVEFVPPPPPPLAVVEAPPTLVQVDFVAPPPPAPPLAPLEAPPALAVLPFVPPPPVPQAPLSPLDAPPVLAELAFVAPPPPTATLPPLDVPPSVIELAFVPPPAPPPAPAAVAPVRAAPVAPPPSPASPPPPPVVAAPAVVAPAIVTPTPPPAPPPAPPASAAPAPVAQATQDPAVLSALLRRGEQLLAIGDVSGARRFFERAANGGSGQAALAMGQTFDPAGLAAIGARGIPPDRAAALSWYRRAAALGEADAAPRIAALEARP